MGIRRFQLGIAVDEDAFTLLVGLLTEALERIRQEQARKTSLDEKDEKRAARLKASQDALFAGQKPPTDRGLLLDTRETARLLHVCPKTVYTMEKRGRMPQAIRIGSAVRWSHDELNAWVAKGCPPQS